MQIIWSPFENQVGKKREIISMPKVPIISIVIFNLKIDSLSKYAGA
jgi:hypothetical protein